MSDRVHALVGGAVLAVALVSCVLVRLTPAAPRKVQLDPSDALIVAVPLVDGVAKFTHECCSCGSVHHVCVLVKDGEIEMYWWADDLETKRVQWRRGLTARDPWPPRDDPWSASER
jgi:hypothetical protein